MKLRYVRILLLSALLISAPTLVFAASSCTVNANANEEECACLIQDPNLTLEECEASIQDKKFEITDKQLNRTYREIRAKLPLQQKTEFVEAQRLWVRLYDKDCSFESSFIEGGSSIHRNIIYTTCLQEQMDTRLKYFKRICENINLNCK